VIVEIDIPDYDPMSGLKVPIVFGSSIDLSVSDSEIVIRANANGLRLLAGHMLTLAQDGVPAGTHLHYEPGSPLEDGSDAFVITRIDSDF
jgi:hypothetical protein